MKTETKIAIDIERNCSLEILKTLREKGFDIFRLDSLKKLHDYDLDSPHKLAEKESFHCVYNGNKYFDKVIGENTIPKTVEHRISIGTWSHP